MQINATPLRLPPMLGDRVVHVGLMDNFRDQLRQIVYQGRVGCRDFGAVDGVGGTVLDEEGEKGEDAADQEGDHQSIDDEEYRKAPTHIGERNSRGKPKEWGSSPGGSVGRRSENSSFPLQMCRLRSAAADAPRKGKTRAPTARRCRRPHVRTAWNGLVRGIERRG